jgi:anthranilate synthase component 2
MRKILIIDNYDSFTYNLVHYIDRLTGKRPDVFRNDEISLSEVDSYDKIVLSPGPGIPEEAGICVELIRRYAKKKSIFGVCLGHQAIGEAFGARLLNLERVFHGVETPVIITDPSDYIFNRIPLTFNAGRYHSWVVEKASLPACLMITCVDDNGLIMGVRHNEFDIHGVQFHPESVMTETGIDIIRNWIEN